MYKYLRIVGYTIYNGISKFQRKISRKTVIIGKVLFDSFYYIVVMFLTYQHNKILMRAKPRALLVKQNSFAPSGF